MTKKHFIALADMIMDMNADNGVYGAGLSDVQIECLANFCARQNPLFNRERWIGYINGESGKNGGKVK